MPLHMYACVYVWRHLSTSDYLRSILTIPKEFSVQYYYCLCIHTAPIMFLLCEHVHRHGLLRRALIHSS